MNQFVIDWGNMGDTSRPMGEDDDLIELMWCNGHVVMQSQTHRKLPPMHEKEAAAAAAGAAAQEGEAGLLFPFALADSLDKDFFSELFCEAPPAGTSACFDGGKLCGDAPLGDDKRGGACAVSEAPCDLMPPPKSIHVSRFRQQTISVADGGDKPGDLSDLVRTRTTGAAGKAAMEAGASTMLSAIGSSICGSNQVQVQRAVSEPGRAGRASDTTRGGGGGSGIALPSTVGSANANASGRGHEATVASSSGRSNCCFGTTITEPMSTSNRSSKRKRLDAEDSESPSEDAESESAALARKTPQKLTTARRRRAAEVHNLSERRRRDRINEKMRALQALIPHCNKTDKASMLDEAIEYLKSLQLQVQTMWMGSGIAPPAIFPGVHHQHLPRMGAAAAMASRPRMPFMVNPVPLCAPQSHGPPGYRTHMPAVSLPEPYARYLGVNHLQPSSQVPRAQCQHHAQRRVSYYPLGAKAVQQYPTLGVPAAAATPGALPSEDAPNTRSG